MDDLGELNCLLARGEWGRLSDTEEAYVVNMSVCLGRLAIRPTEIKRFLALGGAPTKENELKVVQVNRAYLEHARLAAKDVLCGKHTRLMEMGFDWDEVQCLAAITNQQIRRLAATWCGLVYKFVGRKVKPGSELPFNVAQIHAATLPVPERRPAANAVRSTGAEPVCLGIPRGATVDDPQWQGAFHLLAKAMVEERAKARIIEHFTGLKHKEVTALFRQIHQEGAEPGPVAVGRPEYYAHANGSNHHSGPAWNLQGTIFLSCYQHLLQIAPHPLNRGWLLLHAYRAYKDQTERLQRETGAKRLSITHAYSLLTFLALESAEEYADLATHTCPTCQVDYLILTNKELDTQQCPICHMSHSNAGAHAPHASNGTSTKVARAASGR